MLLNPLKSCLLISYTQNIFKFCFTVPLESSITFLNLVLADARIIELPRISFSSMGASKMIYAQWAFVCLFVYLEYGAKKSDQLLTSC